MTTEGPADANRRALLNEAVLAANLAYLVHKDGVGTAGNADGRPRHDDDVLAVDGATRLLQHRVDDHHHLVSRLGLPHDLRLDSPGKRQTLLGPVSYTHLTLPTIYSV